MKHGNNAFEREFVQVVCFKESVKWGGAYGDAVEQSLRRGENDEKWIILNIGTELLLPGLLEAFEDLVEIFRDDE